MKGLVIHGVPLLLSVLAMAFGGSPAAQASENLQVNGWNLITETDPQSLLTRVDIVVRSGSLSDPADKPGLSYFTARALLRGTRTRPLKELNESVERLGASIQIHADQSQTWISSVVLAKNLDRFLDLLRDILTQPAFDPQEMLSLQKILQGELRSHFQDGEAVCSRAAIRGAYQGTVAEAFPWGAVRTMTQLKPDDARRLFQSRFVRENMVIGVTSPFSDADILARITSQLDTVAQGAADAPAFPPPSVRGRRAVVVEREDLSTVPLTIAIPGVADSEPDAPALEIANFVFGADFTSRLMQVLRAENGWTYGASSSFRNLIGPKGEPTLFSLYTFPSVEHAAQTTARAWGLLEEFLKAGITEAEFQEARQALSERYAFSVETAEKRLHLKIRRELTKRPYLTPAEYRQRLAALDLQAVNQAVARHFSTENAIIVAVGDPEALKPILGALPGVSGVEVMEIQP